MRKIVLIFILFSGFIAHAEYNGIHFVFTIQLIDGSELQGYKFIAHGQKNEDYKKHLESKPELLLKNDYTSEPGEYGFYQNRLQYKFNESIVYKLLEPHEIDLSKIKSIRITNMTVGSYAIQIVSEHELEDSVWMDSKPISHYVEGEGMCSHDVFIHNSQKIPNETIEKIRIINSEADAKIEARVKEFEHEINSGEEYDEIMKDIYQERRESLELLFKKHEGLKTVIVSLCTC
jgi:hypothetical protein